VRYKPVPASPEKTTFTQQFFKNIEPGKTEICPDNKVVSLKDRDGTTINLGVFGVLVSSGRKPWAVYSDWVESANKSYADLAPKSDVVIGLTHLNVADDKKLAAMLPQIPLIMGGHDHNNQIHKIGTTTVAKADANAKTVYVHYLRYDKNTKSCTVKSELKKIDPSISEDPQTAEVVAKWEKIKNEALLAVGINAAGIVTKITGAWDCREGTIRSQPAEIGKVITAAMVASAKHQPDCAILNSGSIRVDDVLTGAISELDIVRILPFGGSIVEIEIKGSLLAKTLDAGRLNVGNGGYLQMQGISFDEAGKKWLIAGKPLDINKLYEVVLPEFLLTGNESNMAFLKAGLDATGKSSNPDIPVIHKPDPKDKSDLRNDIRLALIKYLKA
jgi:2',3'-cyclic-nucleotide 2'-phosphodiesterase (5'-nucleotidase family)